MTPHEYGIRSVRNRISAIKKTIASDSRSSDRQSEASRDRLRGIDPLFQLTYEGEPGKDESRNRADVRLIITFSVLVKQ